MTYHLKAFRFLRSEVLHLVSLQPVFLWCTPVRGGLSIGKPGTPLYVRKMKQWAKLVRPTIVKVPKHVLRNIYNGIPKKTHRIIAACGGAISG